MFTRHGWLAALLGIGGLLLHSRSGALEYTLDPGRTVVSFEMRSLGALRRGEFSRAAGTVVLDAADESGELDIVIDASSLTAGSEAMAKFVRGPSMLDTAAHPEIAYRAGRIVFAHGKPSRIDGSLTLLGITQPVSLQISGYVCEGRRCAIAASASLKRSAFGMTRYRLFASDDVQLAIRAEGIRQEPE
jgi:polyisoprenoid-binding protein YceI